MTLSTVLITGATGLIGSDIRKLFLREGYKVYALTRKVPVEREDNMFWIEGDMSHDPQKIFQKIPPVNIVIHAGGMVRSFQADSELSLFREINMSFSEALFKWCSTLHPKPVVIYTSGLNFLQKPLQTIITESHPLAPLTIYGISKYWTEYALFKFANSGYRPISFRISSPVSSYFNLLHEQTVLKKWLRAAKAHLPIIVFNDGSRCQDFVSTKDIAKAVLQAVEQQNVQGIFNIASGTSLSMKTLATLIDKAFQCGITFQENDSDETEQWNISIAKARQSFNYNPQYSANSLIQEIVDSFLIDHGK